MGQKNDMALHKTNSNKEANEMLRRGLLVAYGHSIHDEYPLQSMWGP